jgi:hypothetical protein
MVIEVLALQGSIIEAYRSILVRVYVQALMASLLMQIILVMLLKI